MTLRTEEKLDLTVIMVSYNTRELTLAALEALYRNTARTAFECIVWDNASTDGSAEAIAKSFPQVHLKRGDENIGFARANNRAARSVRTEWMLLLNPDTEVHENAVDTLLEFSKARPDAGITGGRTVFPDGSLNKLSCLNASTIWSLICSASGLTALFPGTTLFNPELIGGWCRDTERQVDIVVGCFFMIPTALWQELGGFKEKYFMYAEEADLCLRARDLGFRPTICPDAQIMHVVGASYDKKSEKIVRVATGRTTLIRDHWDPKLVPIGVGLMWLWSAIRVATAQTLAVLPGAAHRARSEKWRYVWSKRAEWLKGY